MRIASRKTQSAVCNANNRFRLGDGPLAAVAKLAWKGRPNNLTWHDASLISTELLRKGGGSDLGGAYFIGKCLLDRSDRRALKYLGRSVRQAP